MDSADVVVLGLGSGGEVVASRAARAGLRVVGIEAALVGGECPYFACVPSKSLLLSARDHREGGDLDHQTSWTRAVERRDEAAEHRDDGGAAAALRESGVHLVRGTGAITGRSGASLVVRVGHDDIRATSVVIGTGSAPVRPPVEGLGDVPTWTSDEALSSGELPARLLVVGGGPVGCELAQAYASFGVEVVLIERADGLLSGEPSWVGGLLSAALTEQGVDVRTGTEVRAAERSGPGALLHLSDGTTLTGDRVLIAGGRRPRSSGLGLDSLGLALPDDGHLGIDRRCRVLDSSGRPVEGLFAVGDVTGVAPYTHTASYQGRVVAAHLSGSGRDADWSAIPRCVYTTPAVFSVGLGADAARAAGRAVVTASGDVGDSARAFLEREGGGRVELVADAATGALIGATAVGPAADAWAAELALAVRTRIGAEVLADHVRAFPTWQEILQPVAEELVSRLTA